VMEQLMMQLRSQHGDFVRSVHFKQVFDHALQCQPSTSTIEPMTTHDSTLKNDIGFTPSPSSNKDKRKSIKHTRERTIRAAKDMKHHDRPEDRAANVQLLHYKLLEIGKGKVSAKKVLGEMTGCEEEASDDENRYIERYEANMVDQDLELFTGSDDDEQRKRKRPQPQLYRTNDFRDSTNPYGDHGFGLPPAQRVHNKKYPFQYPSIGAKPRPLRYTSGNEYSDSSGIGSMASAGGYASNGFATAIRYKMTDTKKSHSLPCSSHSSSSTNKPMKVSYVDREKNGEKSQCEMDGAHSVTFKQFRRCFCISSKTKKRFAFKSACKESDLSSSSPFIWLYIKDDEMELPVFGGEIIAECQTLSDSE